MIAKILNITLFLGLILFNFGCVGTIEDNKKVDKSVAVEKKAAEFKGVQSATAVSHRRLRVSFYPSTEEDASNVIYRVYVDGAEFRTVDIYGQVADYMGMYHATLDGLGSGQSYIISMKAYDIVAKSEDDNTKKIIRRTLDEEVPIFSGVSALALSSGQAATDTVLLSWIKAQPAQPTSVLDQTYAIKEYNVYRASSPDPAVVFNISNKLIPVSSSDLSTSDSGRDSGTTYYYGVRATDNRGMEEQNIEVLAITTRAIGEPISFQGINTLNKVQSNFGFSSLDVSWLPGTGNYNMVRVVYMKASNYTPSSLSYETTVLQGNPDYGFYDVYNLQQTSTTLVGLVEQKPYFVAVVACTDYNCVLNSGAGKEVVGFDIIINETPFPRVASFPGITGAKVDSQHQLDTAILTYSPGLNTSSGAYAAEPLEYYVFSNPRPFSCDSDLNGGWGQPLEKCSVAPQGNPCYADVLVTGEIPLNSSLQVRIKNLDRSGVNNSDGRYCFGVKAYYDSRDSTHSGLPVCSDLQSDLTTSPQRYGKRYRDPNENVKCVDLSYTPPVFNGVNDSSCPYTKSTSNSFTLSWIEPDPATDPIFTGYRIFFRMKNGLIPNFLDTDAISLAIPYTGDWSGLSYDPNDYVANYSNSAYKYFYVDKLKGENLDNIISSLPNSTDFEVMAKTYFDTGVPPVEYDPYTSKATCASSSPKTRNMGWHDIFAIGPKINGLDAQKKAIPENLARKHFPAEDVAAGKASSYISNFPTEYKSSTNSLLVKAGETFENGDFVGLQNQPIQIPGGAGNTLADYRAGKGTTDGIIRVVWNDVIIDSSGKTLFDEMKDPINSPFVSAMGYYIYRGDTAPGQEKIAPGHTSPNWIQVLDDSGNPLLIKPMEVTTYADGTSKTFSVGEYVDYDFPTYNGSGQIYHYKVEAVFKNGKILKAVLPSEDANIVNEDKVVSVILPPKNMALVHRWIANQEICDKFVNTTAYLNRYTGLQTYKDRRRNNYRCMYDGLGSTKINGDSFYDFGGHLIVDRFEVGVNFTRGQCDSDTTRYAPNQSFQGYDDFSAGNPAIDCSAGNAGSGSLCGWPKRGTGLGQGDCIGTNRQVHLSENVSSNSPGSISTYIPFAPATEDPTFELRSGVSGSSIDPSESSTGGCSSTNPGDIPCNSKSSPVTAPKGAVYYARSGAYWYVQTGNDSQNPVWVAGQHLDLTNVGPEVISHGNSKFLSTTIAGTQVLGKVVASNNANLPPMNNLQPEVANRVCESHDFGIEGLKNNMLYKKRLLRRKEQVAAFAWSPYLKEVEKVNIAQSSGDFRESNGIQKSCLHNRSFQKTFGQGLDLTDIYYPNRDARVTGSNGIESSELCVSRYGLQDHLENVWEYTTDQFYCDYVEFNNEGCSSRYKDLLHVRDSGDITNATPIDTSELIDPGNQKNLQNSTGFSYGFKYTRDGKNNDEFPDTTFGDKYYGMNFSRGPTPSALDAFEEAKYLRCDQFDDTPWGNAFSPNDRCTSWKNDQVCYRNTGLLSYDDNAFMCSMNKNGFMFTNAGESLPLSIAEETRMDVFNKYYNFNIDDSSHNPVYPMIFNIHRDKSIAEPTPMLRYYSFALGLPLRCNQIAARVRSEGGQDVDKAVGLGTYSDLTAAYGGSAQLTACTHDDLLNPVDSTDPNFNFSYVDFDLKKFAEGKGVTTNLPWTPFQPGNWNNAASKPYLFLAGGGSGRLANKTAGTPEAKLLSRWSFTPVPNMKYGKDDTKRHYGFRCAQMVNLDD